MGRKSTRAEEASRDYIYSPIHIPELANASYFMVRVEQYAKAMPVGSIYQICSDDVIPFEGYIEMLLKLEGFMDLTKQPMRTMDFRSLSYEKRAAEPLYDFRPFAREWNLPQPTSQLEKTSRSNKTNVRFMLHVMFRQHASWQGEVTLLGNKRQIQTRQFFRSALELIHLMESAFHHLETTEKEPALMA